MTCGDPRAVALIVLLLTVGGAGSEEDPPDIASALGGVQTPKEGLVPS